MYNLMNSIPAPYALANQAPAPYPPQMGMQPGATDLQADTHLAKGGRASKHKMTIAHMNPHELHILDHLQGKTERCPRTGIRTYRHLEELLKNPHIVENVHHHARRHHAEGGSSHMEHLREGGRHGDTELASIGPNTHHLFNQLAGHATMNPHTGHPEYFSIGNALSGLWDTIKGFGKSLLPHAKDVARNVLPQVMPMAQQALGEKFGEYGKKAGSFLPGLAESALGKQQGPMNPAAQAVSEGLNRGLKSYQGGASPREAFGKGLNAAGQGFGGGLGSAMQGAGASLGQGGGFGEALKRGAQEGFNQMGGMGGLQNMAKNTFGAYQRGGMNAARQAATGQMQSMGRRAMPQYPSPYEDHEDLGDYGRQMFNEA